MTPPLDLEAIRSRGNTVGYLANLQGLQTAVQDVSALVAEVDRLKEVLEFISALDCHHCACSSEAEIALRKVRDPIDRAEEGKS